MYITIDSIKSNIEDIYTVLDDSKVENYVRQLTELGRLARKYHRNFEFRVKLSNIRNVPNYTHKGTLVNEPTVYIELSVNPKEVKLVNCRPINMTNDVSFSVLKPTTSNQQLVRYYMMRVTPRVAINVIKNLDTIVEHLDLMDNLNLNNEERISYLENI